MTWLHGCSTARMPSSRKVSPTHEKRRPIGLRKAQRPGLMMAAIYRTTLDEIRRDGAQKVLNQRTSLTPIRKLWLAWKTWVSGKPPV